MYKALAMDSTIDVLSEFRIIHPALSIHVFIRICCHGRLLRMKVRYKSNVPLKLVLVGDSKCLINRIGSRIGFYF